MDNQSTTTKVLMVAVFLIVLAACATAMARENFEWIRGAGFMGSIILLVGAIRPNSKKETANGDE